MSPDPLSQILPELAALRADVARIEALLTRKRSSASSAAPEVAPLRVTPRMAAQMLCVHYETVRQLITRGVFTIVAPNGRGPGKRYFLLADEVTRYGETGDELAVRDLRARKGRLKPRRY